MSLIELWKASEAQLGTKSLPQIIGIAGNGKLQDGNQCSREFREFLSHITSADLKRYADQCLNSRFDDSGLALQDIVNQVGRRLGFNVEDGHYRGSPNKIGNDGLWEDVDHFSLIVEVKTTDAYRIDLNTIAEYRAKLLTAGRCSLENSSILIVVGRQDTGDLEAQIRGSKHGWDIRLVSVDALLRLLMIKEETEDPRTHKRISEVLRPQEFTRIDGIIDLAFATAEDVQDPKGSDSDETEEEIEHPKKAGEKAEKKLIPVAFHDACAARIQGYLGKTLIRRGRSTYSSPDGEVLANIAVSREYGKGQKHNYWYAFHPHQAERLDASKEAYVAFGCGSAEQILLIPFKTFKNWLVGMNQTDLGDRAYWHVHIFLEDGRYELHRKRGHARVNLTEFLIDSFPTQSQSN